MEIKRTNINPANKLALYRLTKAAAAQFQQIEPGTVLDVEEWAIYSDDYRQRDGETGTRDVLSVVTKDGEKYSSISPTVIRSFGEILDIMGEEEFSIVVKSGNSKAGRKFINCELDTSSYKPKAESGNE